MDEIEETKQKVSSQLPTRDRAAKTSSDRVHLPLVPYKNEYLSVSRIKRYEQCPRSFYFQYVDPGLRSAAGDAASFGSVLHEALESLYLGYMAKTGTLGRIPEEEAVIAYQDAWSKSPLTGTTLFAEGQTILDQYLQQHPFTDSTKVLDCEKEFQISIGEFQVKGFIDRVDQVDDEAIVIVDYKSNRALFSKSELENDLQMSVYGLAARQLYPWAKQVTFSFHMLRHNLEQSAERTAEELDSVGEYVVALGNRMESDTDFHAKVNALCGYCEHRHRCEKYKEALAGKLEIVRSQLENGLENLSVEREQVHTMAKILYARKEEIDLLLKAKLEEVGELDFTDATYKLVHVFHSTYPVSDTLEVLQKKTDLTDSEIFERMATFDAKKVDAFLKETKDPLLSVEIASVRQRELSFSKLDARSKTPKKRAPRKIK